MRKSYARFRSLSPSLFFALYVRRSLLATAGWVSLFHPLPPSPPPTSIHIHLGCQPDRPRGNFFPTSHLCDRVRSYRIEIGWTTAGFSPRVNYKQSFNESFRFR